MKVLVLGSGLLGVSAAYELGKRGFDVTVLDRQPSTGLETSFANGAQLSYSHAEPWAHPALWPKLPGWLMRSDSPLVFRLRADWQMIRWGIKFLRNCTTNRANINCANLLRLGLYSREKFAEIRKETGIVSDLKSRSILSLYGTEEAFTQAKRQFEFQAKLGDEFRTLSPQECLSLEPALAHTKRPFSGGILSPHDETGDALVYCNELAKFASQRYGVKFQYGVSIKSLKREKNIITAVKTDKGDFSANGYVMALGSYSPLFLRPLGIDLPIYPMKGYSLTLNANEFCPSISVTDDPYKIVYSRLGNKLRIAGTAEFAGYNTSINESRIAPIIKAAKTLLPKADWLQDISKWACLRPSTPDGPPILGKTPYQNLFLGTGNGTLGWTQAAGSAALLADIMEGKPPQILIHGLTMERYR